jgi:hypothetical protein
MAEQHLAQGTGSSLQGATHQPWQQQTGYCPGNPTLRSQPPCARAAAHKAWSDLRQHV